MIIIVALFRDLLLNEICSQRTRRVGASGGYIILSSRGHRDGSFGMKEVLVLCFSTVPRVMSGQRAELKRTRGW